MRSNSRSMPWRHVDLDRRVSDSVEGDQAHRYVIDRCLSGPGKIANAEVHVAITRDALPVDDDAILESGFCREDHRLSSGRAADGSVKLPAATIRNVSR